MPFDESLFGKKCRKLTQFSDISSRRSTMLIMVQLLCNYPAAQFDHPKNLT
jgi:hypothetical protein